MAMGAEPGQTAPSPSNCRTSAAAVLSSFAGPNGGRNRALLPAGEKFFLS